MHNLSQLKYLHFLQLYSEIPIELTQPPSFLHGYIGEHTIYSLFLSSDLFKDKHAWALSSGLLVAQRATLEVIWHLYGWNL